MKKQYFSKIVILLLVLACCVLFYRCKSRGQRLFQRLRFQVVQKLEELRFDSQTYTWVSETKKKIPYLGSMPGGTGILFSGIGELILEPGQKREMGILFHLGARSMTRKEIIVSILVERGGVIVFQEKLKSNRKGTINYTFSRIFFDFRKSDRIIIQAQGHGVLIAGTPLVYDLIEKKHRKYVFITALDTLRWDKIGGKVRGIELTPNLNRFKRDSVIFDNAFAQGPWTLSSFTSLFTGLYEYNHQISRGAVLDSKKPFLIEDFAKHYVTAGQHGGTWLASKSGNSRGFDSYTLGSQTKDVFACRTLFENSVRFIEENPVPALFLFLHTYAIHSPYQPPEEFLLRLNQNPSSFRISTFSREHQFQTDFLPEIRNTMEKLYEAEIMALDHYFGEFLSYLKTKGIYDQSLILVLSDHGEEFYEHQGWGHGQSLYNELIKVPLLIKFPDNKYAGKTIKENVGIIDVLPTLLDYLKIESHSKVDGTSLMPLIEKGVLERQVLISSVTSCYFFEPLPRKIALLFGDYKMIYNFDLHEKHKKVFQEFGLPPETAKFQIFDLINDPQERHNLYPEKKYLLKSLQKELREIIKKVQLNLERQVSHEIKFSDKELEELRSLGYLD